MSARAQSHRRQRLGAEPLKALFETSARAWTEQDRKQYLFKGLSLFAMDGTTLKTSDTPAHREHFGAQVYPSKRVSSYPQVRGVTLTAIPTHLIHNAAFGPYDVNEMLYAKELLASIPDDSLTAFDKGFLSAEILCTLTSAGSNRHFVIPAKQDGDLSHLEAMLLSQATGLQAIFTSLAKRAQVQTSQRNLEAFLSLAMKAQSQSRATIAPLVDLKYPRQVAFMKQTNVSHGPQQANNHIDPGAGSRTAEIESQQTKLTVGYDDGSTTMDTRATTTAGGSYPALQDMAVLHRADKRRRQG